LKITTKLELKPLSEFCSQIEQLILQFRKPYIRILNVLL
jgi:hypothetical protein